MSRVLLIYPYFNPSHDRSTFRFPPLGLGYMAAAIRNAGHSISLLDCTFMNREDALNDALHANADVVGIYSMVTMYNNSIMFARYLRNMCDLLIAGGPLPSCNPASFMEDFDIAVIGEGEHTIVKILREYENNRAYGSIPGIAYHIENSAQGTKDNGEITFSREQKLSGDLNRLAFPARDLFPNDKYVTYYEKKFGCATASIITTRGCPFSCEFCSNAVFGSSYRERTPEQVVDEIEQILSYGYSRIHFADDILTLNRQRLTRICEEIEARRIRISWECLARVDSIDVNILNTMRNAGCDKIFFGIESGTDSVLKQMNKRITVDSAAKAVYAAHRTGLKTGAFFIVCYPGETDNTVLNTIRFATSLPLDYLSFTMPHPIPGTRLYERVKDRIRGEWEGQDKYTSNQVLTFDADFSERKMRFAILKGIMQFWIKKTAGKYFSLTAKPFELMTDLVFRLMK